MKMFALLLLVGSGGTPVTFYDKLGGCEDTATGIYRISLEHPVLYDEASAREAQVRDDHRKVTVRVVETIKGPAVEEILLPRWYVAGPTPPGIVFLEEGQIHQGHDCPGLGLNRMKYLRSYLSVLADGTLEAVFSLIRSNESQERQAGIRLLRFVQSSDVSTWAKISNFLLQQLGTPELRARLDQKPDGLQSLYLVLVSASNRSTAGWKKHDATITIPVKRLLLGATQSDDAGVRLRACNGLRTMGEDLGCTSPAEGPLENRSRPEPMKLRSLGIRVDLPVLPGIGGQ